MIDAVLFDLGNVLIRWDPRNHYKDRFASAEDDGAFPRRDHTGHLEPRDGSRQAVRTGDCRAHGAPSRSTPNCSVSGSRSGSGCWAAPSTRASTLLAELRQAGYRIAALTNWSAETFPVARERFPFLDWFEDIVISGVEGIAKPDPAMFALALAAHRLRRRAHGVHRRQPAEHRRRPPCGMHTVHFASPPQCREELRALGVRV